mgnify:CR=1 FL=1
MIWVSHLKDNYSQEIDRLIVNRDKLRSELTDVENQIAQASSLNTIREKAVSLGLTPARVEILPPPPVSNR